MLLIGALAGIMAGLAAGGRLTNLLSVRLRYGLLIVVALLLRLGTQWLLEQGVGVVDTLRVPLLGLAFGLLIAALWLNRSQPGMLIAMAGIGANGVAILVNGGWMPVFLPAVAVAGLSAGDLSPTFHVALPETLGVEFLLRGGPVGDILPLPLPLLANVISIGDVLLAAGIGWFLFQGIAFGRQEPEAGEVSLWRGRERLVGVGTAAFDRPIVLGGGMGVGLVGAPGSTPGLGVAAGGVESAIPIPRRTISERIRAHPYTRLARDVRFSSFWLAQTTSLFGDRLHQVALGVMVFAVTGSALQTGLVFLFATLPNLLLGPIAGTFVDRWDQKHVLIWSDLLRAGLVLTIPFAVDFDLLLVYALVFLVTTVSLFFRPAKAAVLPRIVAEEDLIPANGAIWTAETMADILGYPLAGLFVAFLGTDLALAFWLDSMTYLASAVLIGGMAIPPLVRAAAPRVEGALRAFRAELSAGWTVLRSQPPLFQNTLVSALAQLSIGATIALTVVYARDSLDGDVIPYPQSYAALDAAIGVGNLVGGFVVGAIGARMRKGWMVVTGFLVMGAATVVLGLTSNELVALAAAAVMGVFNLVYVIPTQTLFAELVPHAFMGRVIAIRGSLVMGSLTGAMAVSAVLAEQVDAGLVIAAFGAVTVAGGVLAALLPAVRDA